MPTIVKRVLKDILSLVNSSPNISNIILSRGNRSQCMRITQLTTSIINNLTMKSSNIASIIKELH
jgi:hypothetical protein